MMGATMDLAIRRSVTVKAPVERAFDVFTREVATWWPLEEYSIRASQGAGRPQELHLELREGGRFYERTDGEELPWGSVLAYEPPRRILIEWRVNPESPPTEIEVTFTAEGDGTRVDLVHSGWERFGDRAGEARAGYGSESGWVSVLGLYAEAAEA